MSLSFEDMQVKPVVVSSVDLGRPDSYQALIGGTQITKKEVISTSYNSSQASFQCNPPDSLTIIDRRVLLKVPITLTFTASSVAGGTYMLQSGYDAFRAMPLSSIMQTLTVSVNNNKITLQPSEVVSEVMRFHGNQRDLQYRSGAPALPDQSQEYSELLLTNRNPLAQYGERFEVPARGGFPYTAVGGAVGATTMTVSAVLTEPLLISPFVWGGADSKGLCRVQNMQVQINWESNLARVWSHFDPAGTVMSNVSVALGQPSLLFTYITNPPTLQIPKTLEYQYHDMSEVHITELGSSVAPDASYTMVSSNIQLSSIPEMLLICVKERKGDRTYKTTDSWQSLESVNLSWANSSGLLTGATKEQLYDISVKNGLDMTYTEWSADPTYVLSGGVQSQQRGVGSVLLLRLGEDIAFSDPASSVGVAGTFNLNMRLGLRNRNPTRTIFPALYITPIYRAVMSIQDNQSVLQTAVLSPADVLDSAKQANDIGAVSSSDVAGGAFNVSKFAKQALPYIRKGRKVAQDVARAIPGPEAKVASAILDGAEAFGLGRRGGMPVGGAKMSRAELRRALLE